jgi:formate hydrogenlyase transcriptional activator
MFPLTASGRRLGAFDLGSLRESAYSDDELIFLAHVARQVAVAIDNAHNFESSHQTSERLTEEKEHLRLLLAVNNAVVTNLNLTELLKTVSNELRRVMPHDYASLTLYDEATGKLRLHALDFSDNHQLIKQGVLIQLENTPAGTVFTSGEPLIIKRPSPEKFPAEFSAHLIAAGLQSGCSVPLRSHNRMLGVLNVAAKREEAFDENHCQLLTQIAGQIAIAVENAVAYGEIETLKNKLAEEKLYLEEEIRTEFNFSEIVGHSRTLRHALKEVEQVAPTDAVVLITGETGTGKELIARAIHNISNRRERTMVKLNCAAIPTGLLESELFGHEKGAFTGAVTSRIGRFELANRGTLFLDEVGDIPLELQAKLLRVLQEGEFERLGSSRTVKVDVRVVAATHRDLQRMVSDNVFRADLFYRLNVFPIHLPSLRERRDDIPLLVNYFVARHARRMNKRITTIPSRAMQALTDYYWAGNIRELENFLERAVILTRTDELYVSLEELRGGIEQAKDVDSNKNKGFEELVTLEEMERRYIAQVLEYTNGIIGGKGGAAEILDLPVSTLRSRMKKLGMK